MPQTSKGAEGTAGTAELGQPAVCASSKRMVLPVPPFTGMSTRCQPVPKNSVASCRVSGAPGVHTRGRTRAIDALLCCGTRTQRLAVLAVAARVAVALPDLAGP